MYYPSIFNDVIGPVMRGPSSSHCAAALRIGRAARDLMGGKIEEVLIEFDSNGSLATTHASQGSDMGLFGGLLGWDTTDERLVESPIAISAAGIKIDIKIGAYGAEHPNTYMLTLKNSSETHRLVAISTGGGMIEVIEIDGIRLSLAGDYFETLIYVNSNGDDLLQKLKERLDADAVLLLGEAGHQIIEVKAQAFLDESMFSNLFAAGAIRSVKKISPLLPVLSHRNVQVPFITCQEMLQYNTGKDLALWELAIHYESARGSLTHAQVMEKMQEIVCILQKSIAEGIRGTKYADRILGYQSGQFQTLLDQGHLLDSGMLNQMILYVTAMMEVKSSMGVIVAAPTAGACAGLPGACIGAASAMGLSLDEMTRAMLAAGLIGVFIAAHATFAAEVGGCQAECGSGSGMAAAALVSLAKGSTQQAVSAASMALQNMLGMICDPVANRVEVPCLGKNVMAASNALACANMAISNFDAVIPLDEVIETMDRVGKSIPAELRCTALGGLSITAASKLTEEKLKAKGAVMDNHFYIENRRRMAAQMGENELMLFFSGEGVRKTADENYPFFTNRNFLYLTGVKQEQSALLIKKTNGIVGESLFVLKPDFAREIWTGRRFTENELNEISGIEQVEDIDSLNRALDGLFSSQPMNTLWLCFDALAPERHFDLEREFANSIRKRHPHVVIKNSYPLVCTLRKIKSQGEIDAIRKGMQITDAGIRRMMRAAKPGIMEYALEAEFNAELVAHGQRHPAFPSIVAAGERIFYLHYSLPMSQAAAGDLILTDVGAAYDEYATDISRVFPVSGRFSERQAQIYRVAYAANRAVMAQVRPGVLFSMPNRVTREVSFDGLKALGLLNDFADIGKYVWHGTTHHIGLDTHDVGGYEEPMAENMVFTVDAGIYVREWGIGLRIEDNVLVTADGCENLSASIPATLEEIENLLAQKNV